MFARPGWSTVSSNKKIGSKPLLRFSVAELVNVRVTSTATCRLTCICCALRLCLVSILFPFLFKLVIIHYHNLKQREIKLQPKIKTEPRHTHCCCYCCCFSMGKNHSSLDEVLRHRSWKGVVLLTCNVRAIPKSISFRRASTRRKLAGFKSLWMIPCWWTTWTASSICLQNPCSSPLDILLRFFRKKPARSILPHSITKIIALFSWLSSLFSKGKERFIGSTKLRAHKSEF